jgi:hypothetical protein
LICSNCENISYQNLNIIFGGFMSFENPLFKTLRPCDALNIEQEWLCRGRKLNKESSISRIQSQFPPSTFHYPRSLGKDRMLCRQEISGMSLKKKSREIYSSESAERRLGYSASTSLSRSRQKYPQLRSQTSRPTLSEKILDTGELLRKRMMIRPSNAIGIPAYPLLPTSEFVKSLKTLRINGKMKTVHPFSEKFEKTTLEKSKLRLEGNIGRSLACPKIDVEGCSQIEGYRGAPIQFYLRFADYCHSYVDINFPNMILFEEVKFTLERGRIKPLDLRIDKTSTGSEFEKFINRSIEKAAQEVARENNLGIFKSRILVTFSCYLTAYSKYPSKLESFAERALQKFMQREDIESLLEKNMALYIF